ncbi:MAG: hypothetical protein HC877_04190 [Thioploca sp.]|nr:hypothetical protein [Thioploca sp.]
MFVINSNAIVSINKMTIANGFANYYWTMGGGGIENYGILSITDSILFGNTANLGGGIDNEGELTITNSKLLSNIAEDNNGFHPCGGGGIFNAGTLNITNSTLQGNTTECAYVTHANNGGAGIFNLGPFGANVTLTKSRLLNNIAQNTDDGGGILNMAGGTITIDQSELSSNLASNGGGIYNAGGDVITVNSTLSGNSASWGGGIYNLDNLTVINSTLSNNQATTIGGIFNEGNSQIANSIIANSEGGDCYNSSNKFTIRSTLIEDGSCNPTWSGDPQLSLLANNGGPTLTHALLSGSIAIDNGDDAICIAKPVNNRDQRGIPRVSDRLTGSHCDIGAYEYQNRVIRR